MRLSTYRIVWISLLSMLALLSSELVSSAPLMTFQMASQAQPANAAVDHCSAQSAVIAANDGHSASHDIPSVSCEADPDKMHNCCSAACVSVFAYFPPANQIVNARTHLALIPLERQGNSIERPRSLYRPPI